MLTDYLHNAKLAFSPAIAKFQHDPNDSRTFHCATLLDVYCYPILLDVQRIPWEFFVPFIFVDGDSARVWFKSWHLLRFCLNRIESIFWPFNFLFHKSGIWTCIKLTIGEAKFVNGVKILANSECFGDKNSSVYKALWVYGWSFDGAVAVGIEALVVSSAGTTWKDKLGDLWGHTLLRGVGLN